METKTCEMLRVNGKCTEKADVTLEHVGSFCMKHLQILEATICSHLDKVIKTEMKGNVSPDQIADTVELGLRTYGKDHPLIQSAKLMVSVPMPREMEMMYEMVIAQAIFGRTTDPEVATA